MRILDRHPIDNRVVEVELTDNEQLASAQFDAMLDAGLSSVQAIAALKVLDTNLGIFGGVVAHGYGFTNWLAR